MICILREYYPGALESDYGRQRSCKAKWLETSPENLRNAILAVDHAPYLQPPIGPLLIAIDGDIFDMELLPKGEGKDLLRRCRSWLYNRQRVRMSAMAQRPVFGL